MKIREETVMNYNKKRSFEKKCFLLIGILIGYVYCPAEGYAYNRYADWPRYFIGFQEAKNYTTASQIYWGGFGFSAKTVPLSQGNPQGTYFRYFKLYKTTVLSRTDMAPQYNYINTNYPQYFWRYKDGRLYIPFPAEPGPALRIGDPEYVAWAINWLNTQLYGTTTYTGEIFFDNGLFCYANPEWAEYDTPEELRDAYEYFLMQMSNAFRPKRQIILNLGSCDVPLMARMAKWLDGIFYETIVNLPGDPRSGTKADRDLLVLDRWAKADWCLQNNKIFYMRHMATVSAFKLTPQADCQVVKLSVDDRYLTLYGANQNVLSKIDFTKANADNLGELANLLQQFQITCTFMSPYLETKTSTTLQAATLFLTLDGCLIKFKRAPEEAFLFGYAAVLMVSGPNIYFCLRDEIEQEWSYPKMAWPVGSPLETRQQVAPDVYRRDFQYLTAYVNLSAKSFTLPNSNILPPMRGVLIQK
jgi:hypothetical protein